MQALGLDTLPAHAAKLVGTTLFEITIGMFRVDFRFVEEKMFVVKMKKAFLFRFPGEAALTFAADSASHDDQRESTRFVHLHQMRCCDVAVTPTRFQIDFDGGAALWVDHNVNDFEPYEYVGRPVNWNGEFDFYYVL